jgi:GTP pyrophosphokinase
VPLGQALILAQLGLDDTVVAAGLLHDTLDDTMLTAAQLSALFPDSDVPLLVAGVSKMSGVSQLHRDAHASLPRAEVDALRAMLLAMADVRVVLIKLADRLHNLRTVGALPPAAAARVAAETLEVFCPLASRLGVWRVKAELEDACFRVLHADEHAAVAGSLERAAEVAGVAASRAALGAALAAAGVPALDLAGRPKNLYSIFRKMQRKGLPLADARAVLDARALRVVVRDEAACYAALATVHRLWAPLEGKVKDYISEPKANGYRSLHTVVADAEGRPLEVQIRTPEMHAVAEFGVAAHWRYKERAAASEDGSSSSGEEEGADGAHAPLHSDAEEAARFLDATVAWGRFLLSWESEVSACAAGEEAPGAAGCRFPVHGAGCRHAAAWPLAMHAPPQPPRDAPLYVLLSDTCAGTIRVLPLPRRATVGDLRAALGAEALAGRRVLVNTQPREGLCAARDAEPLGLCSGDVLELLAAEDPAAAQQRAIAAERERLMRIVGLAPPQPCAEVSVRN